MKFIFFIFTYLFFTTHLKSMNELCKNKQLTEENSIMVQEGQLYYLVPQHDPQSVEVYLNDGQDNFIKLFMFFFSSDIKTIHPCASGLEVTNHNHYLIFIPKELQSLKNTEHPKKTISLNYTYQKDGLKQTIEEQLIPIGTDWDIVMEFAGI